MVKSEEPADPIVEELNAIKRLLIGLLMQSGAKQGDVAKVLGISQSSVSRMFPEGLGALSKLGNARD